MKNIDKRIIWIGAGVVGLIILAIVIGMIVSRNRKNNPNIEFMVTPVGLATATLASAGTPTATSAQVGNVWIASRVGPETVTIGGFEYLLAEFTNEAQPGQVITRHCGAPAWPRPVVGQKYLMNAFGVLVPMSVEGKEDIQSPLQRFYPLDNQRLGVSTEASFFVL